LKILITGGKTATALKLQKAFSNEQVVLADYGDVPSFSNSSYQFLSLGQLNEDTIAHNLLNFCLDHEIDALLPLHKPAVEALAKADILFSEFNVQLIIPTIEQLETYLSALLTEKKNWVIFLNGKIIHASQENEQLIALGEKENLTGAFYYNEAQGNIELSLIVI
jgi:hypothetical protein